MVSLYRFLNVRTEGLRVRHIHTDVCSTQPCMSAVHLPRYEVLHVCVRHLKSIFCGSSALPAVPFPSLSA